MNPGHPRYMQACMVRWFYKGSNTILLLHQYYCTSNLYSSKFQKKKNYTVVVVVSWACASLKSVGAQARLTGRRGPAISRADRAQADAKAWRLREKVRERERLTLNHLQQLAMAMLIQTQGPSILFIPPFRYPSLSPSFNSLYRIRSHIDN